jgi:hypothetical protein
VYRRMLRATVNEDGHYCFAVVLRCWSTFRSRQDCDGLSGYHSTLLGPGVGTRVCDRNIAVHLISHAVLCGISIAV